MGCPNQCSFCDQHAISGAPSAPSPEDVYILLQKSAPYLKDPEQTEVAFFGGSFTALERSYMVALLETAAKFVSRMGLSGIRISTRPDAVDDETCRLLKTYGVRVIELGAQSMDNTVLSENRRGHTVEDVKNASSLIHSHGFSLGLQMMTGLYASTPELDYQTARELIELRPDMVRIYPTVTLRGTRLAELVQSGVYCPQALEQAVEECSKLYELFLNAGIPVIRLGLHASKEVEQNYIAGAYHPAFRELCESRILLRRAAFLLEHIPQGDVTLRVAEQSISKMVGQHGENRKKLREMGYCVKLLSGAGLGPYEIELV